MKVILPENISEITLEQYQRYVKLCKREDLDIVDFNKRKIEIFAKIPFRKINLKVRDYEFILNQIETALNTEAKFVNRFKLNNIEFGFIPNFDNVTLNELIDVEAYQDDDENLHKLMAILFRPVVGKDLFKNYIIEDYNGTDKYSELMKQMPMNIVNGALGFFLNLSNDLEKAIQRYTEEELMKVALQ